MMTQLHIIERGSKDGLPVVFIHGFPFSKEMWAPQLRDAALAKGRRLIAYDVRGHGQSSPGDGLYTVTQFAWDLFDVLDMLRVDKAVLVGLSMGGYIALRAAELKPERVRGLVLADTRAEPDSNQAKELRHGAMKLIESQGIGRFADEFAKNLFSPATLAAGRPCVEEIKRIMKANKPLGARGALLAMAGRMDAMPWLAGIRAPALVLVGEHDKVTPLENSETIAKGLPGAKLAVIPDAGHLSSVENPEAFNKALVEFLSSAKL